MFDLTELQQRKLYKFGECTNCGIKIPKGSKYVNYCDLCVMIKEARRQLDD